MCCLNPIYIVMKQDDNVKSISGRSMHEYVRKCIWYNIPSTVNSTPTNIFEKIYTHSMQGFSKYIKQNILQSYQENCTIYNCYICSRT